MLFSLLLCALAVDPASWWKVYQDPELDRLIETVTARNLDLLTAAERIAEARAATGQSRSKLGPEINLTGGGQRLRGGFTQGVARIPTPSGQQPTGSFVAPFETGILQAGLDMRWEMDLFGSNRAALAAARADVLASQERREDLLITVTAEASRYYLELRGIEERLAITRRNITAQKDLLALTEDRTRAGLASQLDIERQRALLATTEAAVPPLESELAAHRHRLALLTEDAAYQVASAPAPALPNVTGTYSSELLKRRPDVRAAEARLNAAMSRLKQARTDLYPKITLNGLVGRQGTALSNISFGGGNFFSLGPQLQLPIFNSGRIKANIAAQESRVQQERLAYRQEIVAAIEEAANALAAVQRQQEREAKLADAVDSARRSLDLAADLQRAGLTDFLAVLDAERAALDAEFQRSTARTQAFVESVALFKALAGGWPQP
jgi:NodT family efflux transporter outer membrane factor (OMF) lipoprotein